MRLLPGLALVFGALLGPTFPLAADDRAEALAVVDGAVKAHGGADALAKAQAFTRIGTGAWSGADKGLPFTQELTVSLPDRMRQVVDVDKKVKLTLVVNGDKGWRSDGGPSEELGGVRLKEIGEEAYVVWLTTLAPLKKSDFALKPLPEAQVNGKAAVGVLVTSKGRPDAKMYFDKESHLLVKIEREGLQAGTKVNKEYLYSDHKEIDGVKLPGKVTEVIDGKKASEITVTSYKLLNKVDDATFGKP